MGQLNQDFPPANPGLGHSGTFHSGSLDDHVRTAQDPPQNPQEHESDETCVVSPPPLPWPRVFPPL